MNDPCWINFYFLYIFTMMISGIAKRLTKIPSAFQLLAVDFLALPLGFCYASRFEFWTGAINCR